jgi:hypothetical protein
MIDRNSISLLTPETGESQVRLIPDRGLRMRLSLVLAAGVWDETRRLRYQIYRLRNNPLDIHLASPYFVG